jgi:hypothetical protein
MASILNIAHILFLITAFWVLGLSGIEWRRVPSLDWPDYLELVSTPKTEASS